MQSCNRKILEPRKNNFAVSKYRTYQTSKLSRTVVLDCNVVVGLVILPLKLNQLLLTVR